jgi:hypothetical protein
LLQTASLSIEAMFKIGVKSQKRSKKHPEEFVQISVKPLELVWTKLREKVKGVIKRSISLHSAA